MAISDQFAPNVTDGGVSAIPVPTQTLTADGTATIAAGVLFVGGGSATTVTLPDPPTGMDGATLTVMTITAQEHIINNSSGSGFNGGGAGSDVATFTAAAGNNLVLVANGGVWYIVNNVNGTLA